MPGAQTFDARRATAFSFDPDDLVLIEDPAHPLYDARVKLPLREEMVLSVMTRGVIVPVVIRKIDDRPVVIDGRQRVKHAREANRRLRAEGKETLKIKADVRKGDLADAYDVTCSANGFRVDDPRRELAAKAQRLSQLGRSEADILQALAGNGIKSIRAVRALLNYDASKPAPERKKRGPTGRPSVVRVKALREQCDSKLSEEADAILGWVLGDIGDTGLANACPLLRSFLRATEKGEKDAA